MKTLGEYISNRPIIIWVVIIYLIIGLVGGGYFFVKERQDVLSDESRMIRLESRMLVEQMLDQSKMLKAQVEKALADLEARVLNASEITKIDPVKLESLLEAIRRIESIPTDPKGPILARINQLDNKVATLSEESKKLRSALNPTDPVDILTVARLGDKFELFLTKIKTIEANLKELEKDTDQKVQRNFQLVDAQVDRIVSMLQWLGLLLIPVILNTIRDLLRRREEKPLPQQGLAPSNSKDENE